MTTRERFGLTCAAVSWMGLIALLFVMPGCSPGAPASTPTAPLPTGTPTATPNPTASAPSLATPEATILNSLFWGTNDSLDIAVISIAGTAKELWETYAPTFDVMGTFELIDMERFEE